MAEVSIAAELLEEAERFGLDVSEELTGLPRRRLLIVAEEPVWQEENREAVESWNAWVREGGLPLAEHRRS